MVLCIPIHIPICIPIYVFPSGMNLDNPVLIIAFSLLNVR